MQQYNAIKAKYPDAMLLFRVGDFYETFGEDAIQASRILAYKCPALMQAYETFYTLKCECIVKQL